MKPSLQNKVVVITGASSGIGAATAVLCAKAGMNLVVGARRLQRLDDLCARIDASGKSVLALRCDVTSDDDVNALVRGAMEKFGRVDAAFANAGYAIYKPIADTTPAEARALFEINFFGTMRLVRAVAPFMKKAGRGHIIINSSAASEIAPPLFGIYSATKAAQDSIAGAMRAELRGQGIFVTSVHAIGTNTEFYERAASLSPDGVHYDHLPNGLRQSAESVAAKIVRAMSRAHPPAEVWPCPPVRFGVGIMTMFPQLAAAVMRVMFCNMHHLRADSHSNPPAALHPSERRR
jgi:short-subunit dehydrogenase